MERTTIKYGAALGALVLASGASAQTAPPAGALAAANPGQEEIVVLGNRRATQALESASLVDLLSRDELEQGGAVTLQESLFRLSPSINFPQGRAAVVGGAATRSASLRGQNPDLTLVLVNGKRRHGSVATGGTFPFGGAGYADVNTIPIAALSRVEVLLDGASAQYGSDAIAGVLNLSLRENSSGGAVTTTLGSYKEGDGLTGGVSGWAGTGLGESGFLNLSADYSYRGETDRSGPDIRPRYFRIGPDGSPLPPDSTAGEPDPREPFGRDRVGKWGNSRVRHLALLANAGADLTDNLEAYGWLNYANTNTRTWAHPEVPASPANVRAIFPDGHAAIFGYRDNNYSGAGGLRYEASDAGQLDLSIVYGRHERENRTLQGVSPSYGLASKTRFFNGETRADQLNAALDYNRDIDVSWLARPLAVQAGVAFRREKWWVAQHGEEQSWSNGGQPILDGPSAGSPTRWGSGQAIAPWDVTSGDREVYSAYIGADFHLTEQLLVDLTGRLEHYSDFGWTITGKLSARYDFSPTFALRSTVSNGYHAPSVGQLAYQSSGFAGTWQHSGVTPAPNRTRQVRPGDQVAIQLGGGPLEPEKAVNLSAGFVWRPADRASLTVDVYQIDVDNRIVTTQALTGPAVEAITAEAGIPDYKSITFFVNGLDTRTRGVDVLGQYSVALGSAGELDLSAGFSRYDTEVKWVRPNVATAVDLFQRNVLLNPEVGTPDYKVVLGVDWRIGDFTASLNQLFYGKYTYVHPANPAFDEEYGEKGYTNIEVSYDLTPETRFTVGANNIFDTYPAQFLPANQVNGINRYSFIHPEGANGAYYYARLGVNF